MSEFGQIIAAPKSGEENLFYHDQMLDSRLLDFWRWSMSNLISNASRVIFAEFIVATALGCKTHSLGREWLPRLHHSRGGINANARAIHTQCVDTRT